MSVASSTLATPATRTKALMVRLSPYLVEAICELTRAIKEKTHAQTEISGLLFGKSQDALVTVEALKVFKDSSGPRSDLARRERMEKAFTAAMTLANEDAEFSSYKLLGWFSLRGGGGLINSDVEFHNHHFKHQEEVALIVWREGDTQLTTELYAAVEGGKLTTEDYRWSSVRLSTELRHVSSPVDLVMRVRMNDDLYMRTYGVSDVSERKEEWKKMADNAKRAFLSFLPGRGRTDVVDSEDAAIPESSGTAKRSFESRTLFRGTDMEPSSATLPAPKSQSAAAGTVTRVQQPATPKEDESEHDVPVPSFDVNRASRSKPVFEGVSGLPMVIPKNRPSRAAKGWPWLSTALVFVACSGLTFAFMALKTSGGDGKISQIMRVLFPGSDLELRASSHGDSLWVSWNKRNPVVGMATGGVLSVNDGPRHFERKLDAGQIADGEVKYAPVSGDVTFQLKVYGSDQSVAMSSLRVLDATSPVTAEAAPPLDVSGNANPVPTPPANTIEANKAATTPTTISTGFNSKPGSRVGFTPEGNRVNEPTATPTTSANKPAAEAAQSPAAAVPVEAPPQVQTGQQGVQTAQQQQPATVTTPPAAAPRPVTPRPVPTSNAATPMISNTAINGWDPNLPENKPAPAQQQAAATSPADSKYDFVRPRVLLQVLPNTRSITPGTISEVTRVEVEVRIDQGGHVKRALLTNPNVKSQLGSAAMAAAKQWTFQPATLRGQPVESDHTIVFEFRPEGQ